MHLNGNVVFCQYCSFCCKWKKQLLFKKRLNIDFTLRTSLNLSIVTITKSWNNKAQKEVVRPLCLNWVFIRAIKLIQLIALPKCLVKFLSLHVIDSSLNELLNLHYFQVIPIVPSFMSPLLFHLHSICCFFQLLLSFTNLYLPVILSLCLLSHVFNFWIYF